MATWVCKLSTFAAFFFLALLLLSATEIEKVEAAAVCDRPSGTWRGPCISSSACYDQCRVQEGGIGGGCFILACYCKFFCDSP